MTIAGAIDKINDKLAGTDKYAPVTIEGALDKLAETIPEGGWGGSIAPATADTLGGVKIGDGINVTQDGTISAGGGYDGVILITGPETSEDPTTYSVLSGSYSDIVAKHQEGGYPSVLAIDREYDGSSYSQFLMLYYIFEEDRLIMGAYVPGMVNAGGTLIGSHYALAWNSDGTITDYS